MTRRRPVGLIPLLVGAAIAGAGAYVGKHGLDPGKPSQYLLGQATVVDGDTLVVQGRKVRLIGIDAPETDQDCGSPSGNYGCGVEARRHLVKLIGALPVMCDGKQDDRYGRLLAVCVVGGRDLNAAMVRDGWAVSYRGNYRAEEQAARTAFSGLWSGDFVLPQDWRKATRGDASGDGGDIGDDYAL
ncbi:MAG: thermonuclease family protein [Hyphomicrobiaceae bacterium]|nr:thermonuclease family protein [Hyphomicrobiaceae bacterium]